MAPGAFGAFGFHMSFHYLVGENVRADGCPSARVVCLLASLNRSPFANKDFCCMVGLLVQGLSLGPKEAHHLENLFPEP